MPENNISPEVQKRSKYILLVIMSVVFQLIVGFLFPKLGTSKETIVVIRFSLLFVIGFSMAQILILTYDPLGLFRVLLYVLPPIGILGSFLVNVNFIPGIAMLITGIGGFFIVWSILYGKNRSKQNENADNAVEENDNNHQKNN